jgi:8-oxo-dGTP diphosphatase
MGDRSGPPRYQVTCDVAVLALRSGRLEILLIRRGNDPFAGRWALPGGFVDPAEDLESCARRELEEETGVRDARLEQLGAFGAPGRDPRGRVVSVAYLALVAADGVDPEAADDAAEARWFGVDSLPGLAFDHAEIVRAVLRRLRERTALADDALALLPGGGTLADLAAVRRGAEQGLAAEGG